MLVLASISESLVNTTSHFVRDAGLPGVFALMAIGSACIPIPSEVVMLFAGFAVADPGQSASHHHMTMLGIVLAGPILSDADRTCVCSLLEELAGWLDYRGAVYGAALRAGRRLNAIARDRCR